MTEPVTFKSLKIGELFYGQQAKQFLYKKITHQTVLVVSAPKEDSCWAIPGNEYGVSSGVDFIVYPVEDEIFI